MGDIHVWNGDVLAPVHLEERLWSLSEILREHPSAGRLSQSFWEGSGKKDIYVRRREYTVNRVTMSAGMSKKMGPPRPYRVFTS
jgi:hypothetical protein